MSSRHSFANGAALPRIETVLNAIDKTLLQGSRQMACFVLEALGASAAARDAWGLLLASLQNEFPAIALEDRPGLSQYHGDGVLVRLANAVDDGCMAVEVTDLSRGDLWDAFIVRLPDGTSRTGWSRIGVLRHEEPEAWLQAVAQFKLGKEILPLASPDFASLAMGMLGGHEAVVSSWDVPERASLIQEAQSLREQTRNQALLIRQLKGQLALQLRSKAGSDPEDTSPSSPTTESDFTRLDQIDRWAAENADRITILPRAMAECRRSPYTNPELVYAALELLAGTYREVRLNHAPRASLMERAQALGLAIGGSVEPSRSTEDYFFRWRGRRVFLDQHLSRGVSRDQRHCLRIYYTWDEEDAMVIVGWLPSHLGNSMT